MSEECATFWGSHGCHLPKDHVTTDYPWHVCVDEETGRPCVRVMEIRPFVDRINPDDQRTEIIKAMKWPEHRWGVTDSGYLVSLFGAES